MDCHVSWLDDQLRLFESQFRDVGELKAISQSLEAEVRGSDNKIYLLSSKTEEVRHAYDISKVENTKLIAKVDTLKDNPASFEANNHVMIS
ncbi:hypothetical protein MKX03_025373, partial [Papaver bracteatum]